MAQVRVNEWDLRYTKSPNIIWENGIAYDPNTHRVVFHGGHVGRLYPQSNYTFLYDLRQNRFYESQALSRPPRRCLVMLDYIDSLRRVMACGGSSQHGSVPQGEMSKDYTRLTHGDPRGPWLYDAANDSWEDCRTLPPRWQRRSCAPVAYGAGSDMLAALGKNDLVLYCPRTNRVILKPLPEELKDRHGYGLAADPILRKLVLFGGSAHGGYLYDQDLPRDQAYEKHVVADTWVYEILTGQWAKCSPAASPPRGAPMTGLLSNQMAYHEPSGTVVLLANGIDRYEPDTARWGPSEVWSFDAGTEQWQKIETKDPPPFAGLLEYAPPEDLLLVFGGGRDGLADDGSGPAPALSRHVYTCRLKISGREPASPCKPERIVVSTDEDTVRIRWDAEPGMSYDVYRAAADPFPHVFAKVNKRPVAAGQFVDPDVDRGQVFAYQLAPANSRDRRSLPAFNQPVRPRGLAASVESPTRVVLRWRANAETDLVGYVVVRAEGAELEQIKGRLVTSKPVTEPTVVDEKVNLADGTIRGYMVMAVNHLGVQSGASPLAYTVPDAPAGLTVLEGLAPSNGEGVRLRWLLSWHWPRDLAVAGFNVYHATEHIDTLLHPGKYEAFWQLWTKITPDPAPGDEFAFDIPQGPDAPANHYFYVRAVNVLGQEGFCTDIVSPTDRRFRP